MKYNGHFRQSSLNLPLVWKKPPSFLSRALLISGHIWSCGLLNKLINLIFCKIYDEKYTKPTDMVNFRYGVGESTDDVKNRILKIFDGVK